MLVNDAVVVNDAVGTARSQADTDLIRLALEARFDELTGEYDDAVLQSQVLRLVEVGDTAGDDQADSGTKTAERDTAQSLLRTILDRRAQFEHALARLEEGTYGWCEGCSAAIPVERLEIFPSATTCVSCKQSRERRAA
ncbi:TraR/DksA family transcriptional regulator [Micromonospora sp. NBC_01796]|uniref:TraR/DksA family transcriptional regulator n=1 Tax=Micromonospora sp. NBC_01796 TaxID=2975987 RepID=UPI002DD95013|nr:TraR/DksA C4-type zinc finger protein [Micromonospora sp. NBC_01796]WSA85337.1 TraR/DksA C4-type zinc finger protein [Micromonospora sp. NBC_01796]